MPHIKSVYFRVLAAGICLLIIAASGCRKYTADPIEFDGWGFYQQSYDMRATDAVTVVYAVKGPGTVQISAVNVQTAEPTITSNYSEDDTDGVHRVKLTLHTNNTPGGTYPVRITIVDKEGTFIERAAKINIVNFAMLLSDTSALYNVIDTLAYTPFHPEWLTANFFYSTKVRHRATDPPNRFIFNSLGDVYNYGTFDNVIVDVDSITGEMTAPPQSVGVPGYNGHGQLTRFDGYHKLKGNYIYTYLGSGGDQYEGHLSF